MSFKLAPYAKAAEATLGAALVVAVDFVNQFSDVLPARYLAGVNTVIVVGTAVRVFATKNAVVIDAGIAAVEEAFRPAGLPATLPVPTTAPAPLANFQSPPAP